MGSRRGSPAPLAAAGHEHRLAHQPRGQDAGRPRGPHRRHPHPHEASDEPQGTAAGAVAGLAAAVAAWRATLLGADDAALDTVGYSTYPNGSDSEETFLDVVWWMNQEVVHHGAEIALLRDLYIRLA